MGNFPMLNTQRVFATTYHDSDVVAYKLVAGRMPTICTVIETIANLTDLLGKIWSHATLVTLERANI
jgi:hypothetical protein